VSAFCTTDDTQQNKPLEAAKRDLTRHAVICNPIEIYSNRNKEGNYLNTDKN
jgi:hypothetical protein